MAHRRTRALLQPLARGLAALLVAACASTRADPPPLAFPGPGRLAVLWHLGEPDDLPDRRLAIYERGAARSVPVEQPLEVRWLGADALLVLAERPEREPGVFPDAELLRVPARGGPPVPLAPPRRYYNVEPRPDGARLVVGVELNDQGDSALELWPLGAASARPIARRELNLDEPRWAPRGAALAVARMVTPPSEEEGASLGIGGVSVPWPRLFALDPDLAGPLTPIHDGARGEPEAEGGSLPLWWDADGVYARQRAGIVRCASPESGCALVFAAPPGRRVVDARPFVPGEALALLVDTSSRDLSPLPSELWRVDLVSGRGAPLAPLPPNAWPLDLDWTP